MRKLLPVLLISFSNMMAVAQQIPERIRFEHLTVADGLPEISVLSMLQDHLGYIWLGTQNGLVRYDGNKMTTFQYNPRNPNSLKGKQVRALHEDANGDIWIGSENLFRFERSTQRFIEYPNTNRSGKSEEAFIDFMHQDNQGNIWTIIDGHLDNKLLLERYNPKSGTWTSYGNDRGKNKDFGAIGTLFDYFYRCFAEDKTGKIWITTVSDSESTLLSYDSKSDRFVRFNLNASQAIEKDFKKVDKLLFDKDGQLYILSMDFKGMFLLNTESGKIRQFKYDPANNNSISSDTIYSIYQDRIGLIWLSTAQGIDRYDPAKDSFIHYPTNTIKPISANAGFTFFQCEAPNGNLWFVTDFTNLTCYDRKSDTFIRYVNDPKQEDGILASAIYTCLVDKSGLLWAGTFGGYGLNKETRLSKFNFINPNPSDTDRTKDATVNAIYEAPSEPGIIWYGTSKGLERWDKKTGVYTHYRHDKKKNNSLNEGWVSSIAEDNKGRFWVGTSNGLNLMDRKKGTFIHFKNDTANVNSLIYQNIRYLKPVSDGKLWIGTSGGVDVFDYDHNKFTHYLKADTTYTPELFDLLSRYTTPGRQVAAILHPGNNANKTVEFTIPQSTDLLATGLGEIDAVNSDDGWLEDASGKRIWEMNRYNSMNDGGDGTLRIRASMIHLNKGNYRLRYKSDPRYSYGDWARQPPYHPELWGIQLTKVNAGEADDFNNEAKKKYFNGLGDNAIFWITEDPDKIIRIGSNNGGVTEFDPASGKFTIHAKLFGGPYCVPGSNVKERNTTNRWVGDYEEGLLLLDNNGKVIKQFNIFNGMPSNTVFGIQEDAKGILWISTNNGLCRFDPVTEKFQHYNLRHGLQGLEFKKMSFCTTADGEMYFGGTKGVNSFYPDRIKTDTVVPPVLLTDLYINGKAATLGKDGQMSVHISIAREIELPYNQNDLTIYFTAINFNRGGESQFAYKLSPNDKDWILSGTVRQVRYTDISPGIYTFIVKAANADGVWNEKGTSITITIRPPWWKTWWAYVIYFIVITGSIWYYIKRREHVLKERQKVLEKTVEVRTADLVLEKKKSDDLLLNILPSEVAEELKTKGSADAKQFEEVTVMFTDFKGFTQISEKLSPTELVNEIDTCFKAFDNIITNHNIEKIKTIGDAYMCAGGLPVVNKTNTTDVVNAAIEIQQFMENHSQQRKSEGKEPFEIRIGIHTGPVVAGIVGVKKFAYDIWGDTVNIASRMESSGEAGKVNISGSVFALVKDKFNCIHRGKIEAKNKGEIDMYFVERPI